MKIFEKTLQYWEMGLPIYQIQKYQNDPHSETPILLKSPQISLGNWKKIKGLTKKLWESKKLLKYLRNLAKSIQIYQKTSPIVTCTKIIQKSPNWSLQLKIY